MGVDDAGRKPLAGCVDDDSVGRGVDRSADSCDLACMHPYGAMLDGAVAGSHDRGVLEDDVLWRGCSFAREANDGEREAAHCGSECKGDLPVGTAVSKTERVTKMHQQPPRKNCG